MRLALVCFAFAVVAASAALSSSTAPRQARILIDVAVSDETSQSVPGLTAAEFDVLVDGRPTPIESFTPPPVPLTLLLLLDVSESMAVYTDSDPIVTAFAENLMSGDRALVGGVANRLQLAASMSGTKRDVISGARTALNFKKEETYGPSPIWDALDGASAFLEKQTGRRGIIFVTDGRGTGNRTSAVAAVERAFFAGITVQVLTEARTDVIRQDQNTAVRVRSGLMLQELARLTGGLSLPEYKPNLELPKPGPVIGQLVKDLRDMYTLAVSPEGASGSFHKIEVKVKRPNVSVRARTGYRT
jgi:Ca-activated chloride channel family protein